MKGIKNSVAMAALVAATGATQAFAQTAPANGAATATVPQAENSSGGLEDIVVTAQRRSENLQKVPISITAITADTLIKAGVNNTQSLVALTPGLQLNSVRSSVTPFLRGVGTINATPGDEGSTAIYVDGILRSVSGANVFALNNIARVEVLRGPQGTLFGRNAVGGLINVITKEPSEILSGNIELGYGNYNTFNGTAYVTGGLAAGVAADLSLYENYQGDGWGRNRTLGIDVNRNREFAASSKVRVEAGPRTTVTIAGDYNKSNNDIGGTRQAIPGSIVSGGNRFSGNIYDNFGEIASYARKEQYGASIKIEQKLGAFALQSITAQRFYSIDSALDTDGYAIKTSQIRTFEKTKTFQQELLLTGSFGKLDITTGIFYFFSHAKYRPFTVSSPNPAANYSITDDMVTRSYAGYAQATYHLTDTTRVTAGLRYTHDDRTVEGTQVATAGSASPVGTVLATTATLPKSQTDVGFSKLTWRGVVDQQITDKILAYASVSRGFKSGVFSLTSPFSPAVNPETLDAYEVGVKADLFDRSLRVNASVFHYDYKDIQLSALNASNAPQLLNAASGRVNGMDAEIVYVVPVASGSLQFRASGSYLDTKYKNFPRAQLYIPLATATNPTASGNASVLGDASGNDFIQAPRFTSSLSVDYDVPLGTAGTLGFTTTWSHNSGFYWEVGNRVKEPTFDVVNGQISFTTSDDKWAIRVYARNIFDKQYYAYVSAGTFGDAGAPAPPRTFGFAIKRTF